MLLLVISTGLFCLPFQTFLPVFARDILKGDSGLYGILTGAYGSGALAGALFLAMRKSVQGLPSLILFAAALFTTSLSLFAFSEWTWLSIPLLFFSGFGMISQYTSVNTLLQTIAAPKMVGRVLSLYGMSFMTVSPLGAIMLGWLAGMFDIRYVIFGSSLLSIIAIAIFATNRKIVAKAIQIQE
jgi:MFS family permease